MPHSSIQDANLSLLPALTNKPLSPEMKARGAREGEREGEADGAEACEEGVEEEGVRKRGREENDFAALLADLVQSLWRSD